MHYVKPTPAAIGPAGHTPLDIDRGTRLPADQFRPIPGPTERWARLAREGSVILAAADVLPAGAKLPKDARIEDGGLIVGAKGERWLREEDIEGYEPPAAAETRPAPATAQGE